MAFVGKFLLFSVFLSITVPCVHARILARCGIVLTSNERVERFKKVHPDALRIAVPVLVHAIHRAESPDLIRGTSTDRAALEADFTEAELSLVEISIAAPALYFDELKKIILNRKALTGDRNTALRLMLATNAGAAPQALVSFLCSVVSQEAQERIKDVRESVRAITDILHVGFYSDTRDTNPLFFVARSLAILKDRCVEADDMYVLLKRAVQKNSNEYNASFVENQFFGDTH